MNKIYSIFIFLLITIIFISCKKEEKWKLPVELNTQVNIRNTISQSNNIVFSNGSICLTEFQFDGDREQAEDMFFIKPLSGGLCIPFSSSNISDLKFDIPQGTYDKILISLRTKADSINKSSNRSISINGTYTDNEGEKYLVKFEMTSLEYFQIYAQNITGGTQIVFDKDIPMTAYITFDPVYWFQTISSTMLDDIIHEVEDDGEDKEDETDEILINNETNTALYDIIVNRIGKDLQIVIY